MDERQSFGQILKRLRLAAGLTHEALAERAGLGARTISDLERGVSRAPRADTLALIVAALDLSPEQRTALEASARPHAYGLVSPARGAAHLLLPLTTFVGREQEADEVRDLFLRADIRLITLTGPGGVGKTRLALHVATRIAAAFRDQVSVVDLAPVADRDGAERAIGQAVGAFDVGRAHHTSLVHALRQKRMLLLLDNFEHLLAAAPLVTDLLRECPHLKVLTTSREVLRLTGEQVYPVLPLPVPDASHVPALETLADYAAVKLFVDRAMRVRPDFALTIDNAAAVAGICLQLDGLPLAVELAAARVRTLPPGILWDRLQRPHQSPLGLLAAGPRDVPARQQTLHDTIAWSHNLLDEPERALFRRLAVFSGGCTLEAAEAICSPPREPSSAAAADVGEGCLSEFDVFDELLSLVDKSLVSQADGLDGAPRFRMLEIIRAFASEQLAASGEGSEVRRAHAAYYLSLVKATGALLFASERTRSRQAAEQGNVQAALQWLVQHG